MTTDVTRRDLRNPYYVTRWQLIHGAWGDAIVMAGKGDALEGERIVACGSYEAMVAAARLLG